MDLIITFFRDILDGTTYIIVCSISAVLLCACIGYLAEKRNKNKHKSIQENSTVLDTGSQQVQASPEVPIQTPTPVANPQTIEPMNNSQNNETIPSTDMMSDLNETPNPTPEQNLSTPVNFAVQENANTPQLQTDLQINTTMEQQTEQPVKNQTVPVPNETQPAPQETIPAAEQPIFDSPQEQVFQQPQVPQTEAIPQQQTPLPQSQIPIPTVPEQTPAGPQPNDNLQQQEFTPVAAQPEASPVFPGAIDTSQFIQPSQENVSSEEQIIQ